MTVLRSTLTILAAGLLGGSVFGDSIRIDGVWQYGVYVESQARDYVVHYPDTGNVNRVRRSDVESADVVLSENVYARNALRESWQAKQQPAPSASLTQTPSPAVPDASTPPPTVRPPNLSSPVPPVAPRPAPSGEGYVTNGIVPHVNLKDVPLDQALKAILRPLNLDYRVEGNVVWVSTPERLRSEPGGMEVRTYDLKNLGDTLAKIIVRNNGGPGATYVPQGVTSNGGAGQGVNAATGVRP